MQEGRNTMLFRKNDTVLFIGDSISDYERKRPVGEGLRNAWGTAMWPARARCWAAYTLSLRCA